MYPNVVSLHLDIEMADAPNPNLMTDPNAALKDFSMSFSHRVKDGVTTSTNYGIEIAKAAALPDFMMQEAKKASDKLSALHELRKEGAKGTVMAMRRKKMLEATQALKQAFRSSRLTNAQLYAFIDDNIHRPMVEFLTANMPEQDGNEEGGEMDDDYEQEMVDDARTLARNTSFNSGRLDEDAMGQRAGPYRQHTPARSRSASVSYVYELSPRPDPECGADADVHPAQPALVEVQQRESPDLQELEAAALPDMMEAIASRQGSPSGLDAATDRLSKDEHNDTTANVKGLRRTPSEGSTVVSEEHDEPMKECVNRDAINAMHDDDPADKRRRSPSFSGESQCSGHKPMDTAEWAAEASAYGAARFGETAELDMLDDKESDDARPIDVDEKAVRRSRSATLLDGGSLASTQALRAQEWAANSFSNEAGHHSQTGEGDSKDHEIETKMVDVDAVTAKLEAGLGSPMSAQDEDDEDDDIEDLLLAVKPEENDANVKYEKAESMEAEGRFDDAAASDE